MLDSLKSSASASLRQILLDNGFNATLHPSQKFLEVHIKSDKPITETDSLQAEQELIKQYHAKILGVSAITSGYRIWGVVFQTAAELEEYLTTTKNRLGHKELTRDMRLCVFHDRASGSVFWGNRGIALRETLQTYLVYVLERRNCEFVDTPSMMHTCLWEKSGHLANFSENMYFTNENQALKPMNCPAHMLLFGSRSRSYRDLPLRMFEFGRVYRNEASGALQGLLRMRAFTQDDGHIFVTPDQIKDEVNAFIQDAHEVYGQLGFKNIRTYLATRPANRAGEDSEWDQAETALRSLGFEELPGEGAFYGPKVELHLEDAMGRWWQCGTIQLDFILPKRMGLEYTDSNSCQAKPIILHRAILGSLERFIAILLENTQGWLPFWLAPVQIAIIPIKNVHFQRAQKLQTQLKEIGIRAIITTDQSLGKNLQRARIERISKAWIIGDKETDCVTERDLNSGECVTLKDEEAFDKVRKLAKFTS